MIYLDNNATTPIDERVLEAMMPFLTTHFANASSGHKFGQFTNEAVKKAREHIADLINAYPSEIIFTSGATESINIFLQGIAIKNQDKGNHIITLQTEHKAVLDTCKHLENFGFQVSYLPVSNEGVVDMQVLENAIRKDTILICAMWGNNEIGTLQRVEEIANKAAENDILFFTDATQVYGKININVNAHEIDALCFSGHKIYAPKGIGALYLRQGIKIPALTHGGGHEKGMRSGTLNVAGIVGLGKASELAKKEMKENENKIKILRDTLENGLLEIPDTSINGSIKDRLFNTTNICFKDVDSDALITALEDIAVSNGSACTAHLIEPSHVLKSIGLDDKHAFESVRFSLGKYNTIEEIKTAIVSVQKLVKNFREML